ncbi:hypothetical protein LCGC14_1744110 [marine sediment metagenome]|uniref:Phage tail tape measure protein domain-containing protein n=1 Tax=marine sediment metagenome TaxID=412755 RepID=A0A0F9JL33_9ZZZZ
MPIITAVMGVAFKALSKVKKSTWNAMSGAMKSVKTAVDPMSAFARLLTIFTPLLKILTAKIMVGLIPAFQKIMKILLSPEVLNLLDLLANLFIMLISPLLDLVIFILPPLITMFTVILNVLTTIVTFVKNVFIRAWDNVLHAIRLVANGFIWFINAIISGINMLMKVLTFGSWRNIPNIKYLHQGTDFVPRTGPYILERGEQVISKKEKRSSGDTHVHIDLRGAVIGDLDRFSRSILEQVMMRIG